MQSHPEYSVVTNHTLHNFFVNSSALQHTIDVSFKMTGLPYQWTPVANHSISIVRLKYQRGYFLCQNRSLITCSLWKMQIWVQIVIIFQCNQILQWNFQDTWSESSSKSTANLAKKYYNSIDIKFFPRGLLFLARPVVYILETLYISRSFHCLPHSSLFVSVPFPPKPHARVNAARGFGWAVQDTSVSSDGARPPNGIWATKTEGQKIQKLKKDNQAQAWWKEFSVDRANFLRPCGIARIMIGD